MAALDASLRARLGAYLFVARALQGEEGSTIRSVELGLICGLHPSAVRRDLSGVRIRGKQGVGYRCAALAKSIADVLNGDATGAGLLLAAGDFARLPEGAPRDTVRIVASTAGAIDAQLAEAAG